MECTCKKIKAESQNPTIMEMMFQIDRLTCELSEVKAENYMLKIDNELLHNRFDQFNTEEENNDDEKPLYSTEEFNGLYNEYNNVSLTRFK